MALTHRARFLAVLKTNESEMAGLLRSLSNQGRGMLLRAATGPDGTIPAARSEPLRKEMQAAVTNMFLVQRSSGDLTPFEVIGGVVVPLSPYMRILWRNVKAATRVGVQKHADQMRRRLEKHPSILARLRAARGNPFLEAQRVQQLTGAVWHSRPFAYYDPAHLWIDARGYRLSDRIWQVSINVRRRIDLLIEEGIRDGRSAAAIAEDLEIFLQPGRALLRTDKPYGTDASADAMRLARTEITRAHAQADMMSAQENPFVETYDVVLSGSHPKTDQCDERVLSGPYTKTDISGIPPFHPYCLCSLRWNVVENAGLVIAQLREEVRKQRSLLLDLIGPMLVEQFTDMLLRQFAVAAPPEPLPFP